MAVRKASGDPVAESLARGLRVCSADGVRKASGDPVAESPAPLRVLVPFAYATARDGEVVQLVKGDIVTDRFTDASIDHLRSIGFVGDS